MYKLTTYNNSGKTERILSAEELSQELNKNKEVCEKDKRIEELEKELQYYKELVETLIWESDEGVNEV